MTYDEKRSHSLRILVLASRKLDMGESLCQRLVTVKVVWVENFLPPVDLDTCVFDCLDELEGVRLGSASSEKATQVIIPFLYREKDEKDKWDEEKYEEEE